MLPTSPLSPPRPRWYHSISTLARSAARSVRARGAHAHGVRVARIGGITGAAIAALALAGVGAAVVAPAAARMRAAHGSVRLTPVPPAPGDTTVVYGPKTFATPTGASTNFIERLGITPLAGTRYVLEVQNGAGGPGISIGTVSYGGNTIISTPDFLGTGPIYRDLIVTGQDTLRATISGTPNAQIRVSVLAMADPYVTVFSKTYVQTTGVPLITSDHFTVPAGVSAPYTMYVQNGNPDGSARIASGTLVLSSGSTGVAAFTAANGSLVVPVTLGTAGTLGVTTASFANTRVSVRITAKDAAPPVVAITTPAPNALTNQTSIAVTGTVQDATATTVVVNGVTATMNGTSFSATVPIGTEGSNTIHVVATDAAGNATDSTRTVIRDTQAPALSVAAPANGFITKFDTVFVRGSVADSHAVTVSANEIPLPVDQNGQFVGSVPLVEGSNFITIVATDAAGNTTTVVRTGTKDATPPVITISSPADGSTTQNATVTVTGTVQDATAVTVTVNGTNAPVTNGNFSADVSVAIGSNTITVIATDAAGNSATRTESVTRTQAGPPLPPDPSTVATPLSTTSVTPFSQSVAFLYSGNSPIQTGVAPGTIGTRSASVIKGALATANGQPVSGAQVTILGASQYGSTVSRADGAYDMVVNGGTPLTIAFTKSGYLPVQRHVTARWGNYTLMDTVVMTPLDTAVTAIDFTAPIQSAKSSVISDGDGAPRHMTMMFRAGTQATLRMPDGSTQPVTGPLHVRATEFTVGRNGLRAMPALLPPASAYTYAAELSTDEGIAAGAASVEFSTPVATYVENFLKFPVGMTVPAGYYDRVRGVWVSSAASTRVVKIASVTNGLADLVVDTTAVAATPDRLAQFGIDSTERAEVARQFAVGETLWRTAMTHFTPWDINAPWQFPADVTQVSPRDKTPNTDDHCKGAGSIIDCEEGTLGEVLPIAGTPFALTYNSGRAAPDTARNVLSFEVAPVTGSDSLTRTATVNVTIAGRTFTQSYPGTSLPQHFSMTWDGLDSYGRKVDGAVTAAVQITYDVRLVYLMTPDNAALFGVPCNPVVEGSAGLHCILPDSTVQALGDSSTTPRLYKQYTVTGTVDFQNGAQLGTITDIAQKMGGWRLSPHHIYDPSSGSLFLGTGERHTALGANALSISTVAGMRGQSGPRVDSVQALATTIGASDGVTMGSDGSLYIASGDQAAVRRVLPNGLITTFAGTGSFASSGDGGPATQAGVDPWSMAIARDGSMYIAEADNNRIRRVDPNGIITTVVGNGNCGDPVEGALAMSTPICFPEWIAIGPDGALYFTQNPSSGAGQIDRVGADGIVRIYAGASSVACNLRDAGNTSNCGDGGPARTASMGFVEGLAFGADGSLYVTESDNAVVRVIDPSGVIRRFAGRTPDGGNPNFGGDGGPAVNGGLQNPGILAVGPDGSVFIGDDFNPIVRQVTPDGIITSVMGDRSCQFVSSTPCTLSENGPSRLSTAQLIGGLAVGADNTLYVTDVFNDIVRRIALPSKPLTDGNLVVGSEDLKEYYVFDPSGRHLRTVDPLTGSTIYSFGYDTTGLLTSITDRNGRVTAVERDASGNATAIVSPFGLRTRLAVDGGGLLSSVTDPSGHTTVVTMTSTGRLTDLRDSRGGNHVFTYDAAGRLQSDQNAEQAVQHVGVTTTDTSRVETLTSAAGRQESIATVTLPSGGVQFSSTNAAGLLTTNSTSTSGEITTRAPDSVVTSVTQAAGDPRFGLDAAVASKLTVRMPSGLTAQFTHSRNVVRTAVGAFTISSLVDSTRENGRPFVTTYDAVNRSLRMTTPGRRVTTSTYDSLGRVTSFQASSRSPSTVAYLPNGQVSTVITAGRRLAFTYDSFGRLASTTDPVGSVTRFTYDSVGHLTRGDLPGGLAILYGSDAAGNDTLLTIGHRAPRSFTFTPEGRLSSFSTRLDDGSSAIRRWQYDADGMPTRMTLANGDSVVGTYDGAGRVVQLQLSDGSATRYAYSPSTGHLTQATSATGESVAFSRDGSLVTALQWSGAVAGSVQLGYNTDFRITNETVNGAAPIAFAYDADGLLTTAGGLSVQRDSVTGAIAADSIGTVGSTRSYDANGQPSSLRWSAGGTPFFTRTFTRDSAGRITTAVETVNGVSHSTGFSYDSAGRLSAVATDGAQTAQYQYDEVGNRVLVTSPNGALAAVYDGRDGIRSLGTQQYVVSGDGFVTARVNGSDTTRFTYNDLGQLIGASSPTLAAIAYVYDVDGRLVSKTRAGTVEHAYIYGDGPLPAAELAADGSILTRFVYTDAGIPAYMVRGGVTYRFITDERGSVRFVVNTTDGSVAQAIQYDAFGNITANSAPGFQPFGFVGGLYDEDLGLTLLGAREYDAAAGRWFSPDPGLFSGGPNLYAYGDNDPVNFIDRTGAFPEPAEIIAGGVLGAFFGGVNAVARGGGFMSIVSGILAGGATGALTSALSPIPGAGVLQQLLRSVLAGGAGDIGGDLGADLVEKLGNYLRGCPLNLPEGWTIDRFLQDALAGGIGGATASGLSIAGTVGMTVVSSSVESAASTAGTILGSFVSGLGDLIFSATSHGSKK